MIQERLRPILEETRPLAGRFTAAGHRLYLVGGIVRDLLADRPLEQPDIDLTTDARPEQTKALLSGWADAVWTQGERFGTIGAKKGSRSFEQPLADDRPQRRRQEMARLLLLMRRI